MGNAHSTINLPNRLAAQAVGRHSFPHMSAGDVPAWLGFLKEHPWLARRMRYDVPLGSGARRDGSGVVTVPPSYAALLCKRVDAVLGCWWGFVALEAKPIAGAAALGQCAVYRQLLREQTARDCEVAGCVVCEWVDADCASAFASAGLWVWSLESGWQDSQPSWSQRQPEAAGVTPQR
jgi:hypothetical protein